MRQIRWVLCFLAVSLPAFSQTYEIVNQNSGLALDVQGASTNDGALIQQYSFWGGQNQLWKLVPVDGESYEIVSVLSGKVLDVQGASTSQGALIQQYDYLGGGNQQWRLVPLGNGYYKIVSNLSGMVLDVQGASTSNGALLQQWPFGGGANQQWQLLAYTPAAPANISVTPSSGAGSPQTFEFTASSTNGYMDIGWYQIIFNSSLTATNGCYLWYTQNGNYISMADVTDSYWVGGGTLGSTGTLSNGLCQLNLANSAYGASGNSVTISLAMTFTPSFAGAKNVYLASGEANTGIGTGWQQMGTWTAPGGPVYQGWVDQVSCSTISGWAWNANQPSAAQTVNFYVDGNASPALTVIANQFRQDLVNAGYGTGYYGYSFATPAWLQDGSSHTVDARYGTTGVELWGSPKTVQCGTGPVQYYLTTSSTGSGSISPVSGYYNAGQIVVTATPYANSGAVFAGFSGALTGTASTQTLVLTGDMSVTANFTTSGATNTVASTPSILPFTVDGTTCTGGMCSFAPTGSDTLSATPMAAPTRGPAPGYLFTTMDGHIAPQAIGAPILGEGGPDCAWGGGGGGGPVSSPIPVGPPQPAPFIASVTMDSAGQVPAVVVAGVPTTIYINGFNFGTSPGFASFCVPGGSPCDYSKILNTTGSCPGQCSWTPTQIQMTVTINPADPNADAGQWWVYLNVPFWIAGSDLQNPSMGNFQLSAAEITMGGTVIASSIGGPSCPAPTCWVVVGQQVTLTGYPAGGFWTTTGTTWNQWAGDGSPPAPVNGSSNPVSFFWVTGGTGTVTYMATSGATATAYFSVAAPTLTALNYGFGQVAGNPSSFIDPGNGGLDAYAQLQATVVPPTLYAGNITWIQVLTGMNVNESGPLGVAPQTCNPPGNPPWLDTSNPYPYVTNAGNSSQFRDLPNVDLAAVGRQGETTAARQLAFDVYVLWQPLVTGTAFPVPLGTMSWAVNDGATLANGVWTPNGGAAQSLPVSPTSTYPTWLSTATAPHCVPQ